VNATELEKHIKDYKVIRAFEDGVTDALIHGVKDDDKTHHYYNQGFDFGTVLYAKLMVKNNFFKIKREKR
tara:strand:+ start:81 stop:290 length:210 start_codon:yes stop_codon:yes gene_type:complete